MFTVEMPLAPPNNPGEVTGNVSDVVVTYWRVNSTGDWHPW